MDNFSGRLGFFLHRPSGTIDLAQQKGTFKPQWKNNKKFIDLFIFFADEPVELLRYYAELTGYPTMPPLWALGYQQSHRDLKGPHEVFSIAEKFRQKSLPCDVLIYLGTGWCPRGWNLGHGSLSFNPVVFPNPSAIIKELHDLQFKTIFHVILPPEKLYGSVCDEYLPPNDTAHAAVYWRSHIPVMNAGADGWWPDTGENLSLNSRFTRVKMYWEGPQLLHPNKRSFALHRTGSAGIQRFGGWIWSGDVYSTWDLLQKQIPISLNTSVSGLPYWGTDIGGFWPTKELTGELYIRWFQFGAFCPLFRSHGRTWHLRLPWGWNTGDPGPIEITEHPPGQGTPDMDELRNAKVESICRDFLNLRYRLMPYTYSIVREAYNIGLPIMRPLWLYYPNENEARNSQDQYFWGKDLLIAPVIERGSTTRKVYLPPGEWYNYWTNNKIEGGHYINVKVELETIPIYIRAGAIIPFGPIEQYTGEKENNPLTVLIYPGRDGHFILYEDDGNSFDFQQGKYMEIDFRWKDHLHEFSVKLNANSQMLPPLSREIKLRVIGTENRSSLVFRGDPIRISF